MYKLCVSYICNQIFSLLLMVYRTSKPHFAILGKIKGSDYYKNVERFGDEIEKRDDLLILRFDSQLYFGNKSYFKTHLMKEVNAKGDALKGVILNAEAINYIDSTAANMLISVINELHKRSLQFYIAGAIGPTRDIIFRSGIIDALSVLVKRWRDQNPELHTDTRFIAAERGKVSRAKFAPPFFLMWRRPFPKLFVSLASNIPIAPFYRAGWRAPSTSGLGWR